MDNSKKLKVGIIVDDIDQSYLIYDFYKKSLESNCYDVEYLIIQKSNNLSGLFPVGSCVTAMPIDPRSLST